MTLTKGKVIQVVRPLYGISESELDWYLTYMELQRTTTLFNKLYLFLEPDGVIKATQVNKIHSLQVETPKKAFKIQRALVK